MENNNENKYKYILVPVPQQMIIFYVCLRIISQKIDSCYPLSKENVGDDY